MATLNSHGMEPQEAAIMDAWDAAKSVEEIAALLDIGAERVEWVVDMYDDGRRDRWALRVPAASARLAQAIAKLRPEMMAA